MEFTTYDKMLLQAILLSHYEHFPILKQLLVHPQNCESDGKKVTRCKRTVYITGQTNK